MSEETVVGRISFADYLRQIDVTKFRLTDAEKVMFENMIHANKVSKLSSFTLGNQNDELTALRAECDRLQAEKRELVEALENLQKGNNSDIKLGIY